MKSYIITATTINRTESLITSGAFVNEAEARRAGQTAILSIPHWWNFYAVNLWGYPEIIVKEG